MFVQSKPIIPVETTLKADSGYQGINAIHANSIIPRKNTKLTPLSKADKQFNHALSSDRIFVEHVIGRIKIFKILSDRYRNRRKRFNLRFNLIAGIYNYELGLTEGDF